MKTCFRCLRELPIDEFYKHPQMADGHLGKCKSCTREDVRQNSIKRADYYKAYERERSKLPHRRALARLIASRPHHKERAKHWLREYRKQNPKIQRAHNAAIRIHKQAPSCCQMCGQEKKRLQRHHPDYDLPKLIVWLCAPCHRIADQQRRENERNNT